VSQKQPSSEEVEKMMKTDQVRAPSDVAEEPSTLTLVLLLLFSSPFLQNLLGPHFPLVEKEKQKQKEQVQGKEKQVMVLWVWRWVWEEEEEQKERAQGKRSWERLVRQEEG
jgi:hypothetical protein